MANLGGTPSIDSGPPFADWREQLRERVKEIRARKMAAARQAEAPMERAATRQTEVPIDRPSVPEVHAVPTPIDRPSVPEAHAVPTPPGFQDPAAPTPQPTRTASLTDVVSPVDVATEELRSYGPPVDWDQPSPAQQEDDLRLEPAAVSLLDEMARSPVEELIAGLPQEEVPPSSAEDIPLFQEETKVFEDAPTPAPKVPEGNVEPPVWARTDNATDEPVEMAQSTPPPDLDAIPDEMKDVEIPAWALPRQASEVFDPAAEPESTPEDTTASHPDDFMLVGEFSSVQPDTTGRDSANGAAEPSLVAGGTADADSPATAALDVAAVDSDFGLEPGMTELEPAGGGRPFPGLFDPAEMAEASPQNGVLEQTESLERPDPEEAAGAIAALGIEAKLESPLGSEPEALEWDLDAPADPDTILDAQRDPSLDPSAPVSDRVFSAVADALVLLTLGVLLSVAGASAAGAAVVPFVQAAPLPFAAAWLVFAFAYGIFFVGTSGQTLGKMAMRVRVIGCGSFQVGYARAAARAVWYTIAALPAFLGLIPALRDPEHRALHDRLSGTRVVKA